MTEGSGRVRVEILLAQGHRETLELERDSPVLRDLVLALGQSGDVLVEVPLEGEDRVLTVPASSLVGITTEPPLSVLADQGSFATFPERRDADHLEGHPPILVFAQRVIVRTEEFPRFRELAERLLAGYQRRSAERRQRLREIVERLGERTLAVSTFNSGYAPMFENWVASCDRHGIAARRFTVLFPTDEEADRLARERGFVTYFDGESMGAVPRQAHAVYGDGDFALAMFPKVAAVQDLLELGVDLVRQDMDLVWFEDPRPRLDALARASALDLLFMRDPNARFQPLYYNSGFVFVRNNELTRRTFARLLEAVPEILYARSEQEVLQQIVLCYRERGLRTGRLPDEYVDGEILNRAHLRGQPLPERPVVAHVSWTANLQQKIERFRGVGMWYLDDESEG